MAIDGANTPQAGGSLPGGTGSSVVATIIKNPRIQAECFKFKRTFQVYTGGYKMEQALLSTISGTAETPWLGWNLTGVRAYMTPLSILSPDMLFIFMTQSQHQQLPDLSYAKTCRIKVTPLGYRLPFGTNEASAGFANSQTLVQIGYGVGINTQMNMAEVGYMATAPDYTDITGFIDTNLRQTINGTTNSSDIGCSMGVPRHWNNYTVLLAPTTQLGNPNLTDLISIQNVNDCKGTPVIDYKYDYKNGLLKYANQAGTLQKTGMNINFASFHGLDNGFNNIVGQTHGGFTAGGSLTAFSGVDQVNNNARLINVTTAPAPFGGMGVSDFDWYTRRVEKSHWLANQEGQMLTPDRPPLVHFGCMPVQANPPLADPPVFANCAVQWEVEAEMDVCCNFANLGTFGNPLYYLKAWDPVRKAISGDQDVWVNNIPYMSNRFMWDQAQSIK